MTKIIGTPTKNFIFLILCLKINIESSIKGAPPAKAIANKRFSGTRDLL